MHDVVPAQLKPLLLHGGASMYPDFQSSLLQSPTFKTAFVKKGIVAFLRPCLLRTTSSPIGAAGWTTSGGCGRSRNCAVAIEELLLTG